MTTSPRDVHAVLSERLLADGLPLVFDPEKSSGSLLHDARAGKDYLDFFGFFASQPVGFRHPHLDDPDWVKHLAAWAKLKPANSDVYTVPFADFVAKFQEVAVPAEMRHLFFIEGGALAVENAIKVAFDWKTRLNHSRGKATAGELVIHLRHAFHGRSGYTMSLTNTDPAKVDLFPKFDWPRVSSPYCAFPLEGENLAATIAREEKSLAETRQVLEAKADSVAAFILEPIQCEGGDHHFRPEYLGAVRELCDEHDVLLVFDEVQTGMGVTGTMWAYQQLGVVPDVLSFGKKAQVCGIMATDRVDQVPDNVFAVSSRINSTWGGNLLDMIRAARILEIYQREDLLANTRERGAQLLEGVRSLAAKYPALLSNCRGRGLLVGMDLPDAATRGKLLEKAYELGLLILACGERSVRFRPVLDIRAATIDQGLEVLDRALATI